MPYPQQLVGSFRENDKNLVFKKSAFKHNLSKQEIIHVENYHLAGRQFEDEDGNPKNQVVGFGTSGRLVEVIWIQRCDKKEVIHAMKIPKNRYRYVTKKGS